MDERLEAFLVSTEARWELVSHPSAVTAQEQASLSHTPGRSMAKVVIVKVRDGLVMAVVSASSRLDLHRLGGLIGHGGARLAPVEEIRGRIPGCMPGAIPPFGHLFGMPTFVDRELIGSSREITMPAGDPATAIRMSTREYERLASPRVGDFAVPEALVVAGAVVRQPTLSRRAS